MTVAVTTKDEIGFNLPVCSRGSDVCCPFPFLTPSVLISNPLCYCAARHLAATDWISRDELAQRRRAAGEELLKKVSSAVQCYPLTSLSSEKIFSLSCFLLRGSAPPREILSLLFLPVLCFFVPSVAIQLGLRLCRAKSRRLRGKKSFWLWLCHAKISTVNIVFIMRNVWTG